MSDRTPVGGSSDGSSGTEVEWQFAALDVRPVKRWLEGLGERRISVRTGSARELTDIYYDTADWRVYRAGFALRVRHKGPGKKLEATMKSLEVAAIGANIPPGPQVRREISEGVTGAESGAALREAPGAVGQRIRALIGQEELKNIFEVRTRRQPYSLHLGPEPASPEVPDETSATDELARMQEVGEVVLDETEIPMPGGERPAVLRRVEVELTGGEGRQAELEGFVEALRRECRLTPALASKYESAVFALGLELPEPPEFGPKTIAAEKTIGEVVYAVMRRQFEVFLRHEPGTRLGEDPEELHDMRVASRRARSAIQIFPEVLPVGADRFKDELKWIAGELGEVRDLDVQLEQLAGWISGSEPEDREPLSELSAAIEERRDRARHQMLRALNSRRYARFVTAFSGFLRQGPNPGNEPAHRPVTEAAPQKLRGLYRKVHKAGNKIEPDSPAEQYHKLRIRCKRLRYAAEFLRGIYRGPAEDFIKALKGLQDVLGDHQDAQVAITHLRELATASDDRADPRRGHHRLPPQTVFAMGGLAHRYRVEAKELRGRFPKAYARMMGKRWKRFGKALERRR